MENINHEKIIKIANKLFSGSKGLCLIRLKGIPEGKIVELEFIADDMFSYNDFKEQVKKAIKFIQTSYQVRVKFNMIFDEPCDYWEQEV